GAEWNRDPGLLDVYARVKDPNNVDYVIGVLDGTATRFRAGPPDLDALAALKSRLRYDFLTGFATAARAAERVARPLAISAGLEGLEALYTAYAGVAPDDVQAAADAYLRPERRTIGVLRGTR